MDSDSVSPGSNPGSPASFSKGFRGFPASDKQDKPEQTTDARRTKVGTVRIVPSRKPRKYLPGFTSAGLRGCVAISSLRLSTPPQPFLKGE